MHTLFEALARTLGPAGCTTDAARIAPRLREWRGRHHGRTPLLVMPRDAEETAAVVRLCAEAGAALTLQGGNTGLVGGQIPDGEVLLSLERMQRIRRVDVDDAAMIVEAGCTLETVRAAAQEAGLLFPLQLGSGSAATIGGLVSTNAGGVHVLRYGMMRDLVLGLEVVLADGSILRDLSSLRKNNTGYDLKQLFIGGEGTLGIITAASLKLAPRPAAELTAAAALPDPVAALRVLRQARAQAPGLIAFELMNRTSIALALQHFPELRDPLPREQGWLALLELTGADAERLQAETESLLSGLLEQGCVRDAAIAASTAQAGALWSLRERIPAAHRLEGAQINHDIAVPVSAIPDFLEQAERLVHGACPGARIVAFGHVGDGNIHYTVLQPAGRPAPDPAFTAQAEDLRRQVQEIAHALGGSISAEHGVGVARRAELAHYKSREAMALMRRLKQALDPRGVLNPRVLFEPEESAS